MQIKFIIIIIEKKKHHQYGWMTDRYKKNSSLTTWAKCSSPTCPSCDSHTAGGASWCQWAHRASPPMGAKGSRSGHPWCHLAHLHGNHEMIPALWLLVSMRPGTSLWPADRQQTHVWTNISISCGIQHTWWGDLFKICWRRPCCCWAHASLHCHYIWLSQVQNTAFILCKMAGWRRFMSG